MEKLTPKQSKIYKFIERYQFKNGASPTIGEMRKYLDVSSDNSILKHLNGLTEKGYIKRDNTPRGIKMLANVREQFEAAADLIRVPLLGTIPAGGAVDAEEHILDTFEIGHGLMKSQNGAFLLRVTGNSMIDAGIFEGDMVLVLPEESARHGDVVVALVDGDSTVKRYMNEKGKVYLKAENPEYENIYPQGSLEIQGVVSGLIRNY
jgi:repressor LexA